MDITAIFGSMVFDEKAMRQYLPSEVVNAMQNVQKLGERLDPELADTVATAMKDWAIAKGATHYSHWFQPMTGTTAEKHDSFIMPDGHGGVITAFSGKELIKGEPDASSLPSGGLRATFEARGYTAWDPTSFAFIKDKTLYIPTAFCAYGGESLDKKTPLLRSMEALQKQAMRILKLFGNEDVSGVRINVGAEQEYFLIDEKEYSRRPDLIISGHTLFGANAPKGQELDDHYFGNIKPCVKQFMEELDEELWKLGVLAKTEHNETAPGQHELAPVYTTVNVACDHNQLMMELMQNIARRHGMVCLLHEKPFSGINGSGKHINWSMSTDTGVNLLSPGDTPYTNAQFLLFLTAVIRAVDDYQDALRISVASAGNDNRLGACEAPPAILSVYIGDELTKVLEAIESEKDYSAGQKELLRVGVHALPRIPKDTTDRNRTSPFAFTGNKFEFRMLGSSASISDSCTVINTAVAQELKRYADALEISRSFEADLHEIIADTVANHRRILFGGNCYGAEWEARAAELGLSNLKTTPDALSHMCDRKNIELFTSNGVLTEVELRSRCEIMLDNYCKITLIDALTMLQMAKTQIMPAINRYIGDLADTAIKLRTVDAKLDSSYQSETLATLCDLASKATKAIAELEASVSEAHAATKQSSASVCRDRVLPAMHKLRAAIDASQKITDKQYWPYPGYDELMLSVR